MWSPSLALAAHGESVGLVRGVRQRILARHKTSNAPGLGGLFAGVADQNLSALADEFQAFQEGGMRKPTTYTSMAKAQTVDGVRVEG